jgi:hypothetical protein
VLIAALQVVLLGRTSRLGLMVRDGEIIAVDWFCTHRVKLSNIRSIGVVDYSGHANGFAESSTVGMIRIETVFGARLTLRSMIGTRRRLHRDCNAVSKGVP